MNGVFKKLVIAFSSFLLGFVGGLPLVPQNGIQGSSGKLALNRSVKNKAVFTDTDSDGNCIYFFRFSDLGNFSNVSVPNYNSDLKAKYIGVPFLINTSPTGSNSFQLNFSIDFEQLTSVVGIPSSVKNSTSLPIMSRGCVFYSPLLTSYGGTFYINNYYLGLRSSVVGNSVFKSFRNLPYPSSQTYSSSSCLFNSDSSSAETSGAIFVLDNVSISSAFSFGFSLDSIPPVNDSANQFFCLPFITFGTFPKECTPFLLRTLQESFLSGFRREALSNSQSYKKGFADGEASMYDKAYTEGYNAGKAVADSNIYQQGYNVGYSDGSNTLTPATTIWGLFGAIASVPTEILNGMGNIAIWNTPILAVLFSLLFLALVLWIIRKFI